MKCPSCQTENDENRRFCRECGSKLLIICHHCSFENSPGDKFCGGCGQNLTQSLQPALKELSFDEKIEKIQKYLPKGLTDKILSQRDKIEGENKQVTVFFADVANNTSISEKLDPEEIHQIMDGCFKIRILNFSLYNDLVCQSKR